MKRVSEATIPAVLGPNASRSGSLYRQLYESIREQVLFGHFSPGQKMPSSRILAADLGVSRNTVLNAFDQLKAEGYLEGTSGSGTYVARALPDEMTQAPKARVARKPAQCVTGPLSRFGSNITKIDAARARTSFLVRPFQPGIPAVDAFPFDVWARISNSHWKRRSSGLLSYGQPAGYPPLRKAVADYLRVGRAVHCDPEQVIIVSGAQEAIDLTVRLLIDPGDSVWVEDPTYPGARAVLNAASAKLIPVPVDEGGLSVAEGISRGPDARLVYTTPCHQFPLGTAMAAPRRLELLDWAAKSNAHILEDDYDSEFRYSTRPLPALQSLDQAGSVIYFGTFSKVLFPSLRLGYLVAPPDLVDAFMIAKAVTDRESPTIEQAILAEFILEGHFGRHIRRMRALYLERLEIFLDSARAELSERIELPRPGAGMHAVALFPPGFDDRSVAARLTAVGVSSMPLSVCSLAQPRAAGLVLGFGAYGSRQTRLGMRKLAAVLNKEVGARTTLISN
ncbi:MAG TPA: PLP-dependent aminotransferase family protein [Blastocatellia bacterium]|nr:PLP-dependent aminotransferase family protein [Blastocatellia bacterium]